MASVTPLIVIIGETASGKSALAMDIASRYNGEIICADSRTVYTGLDIGTAKPGADDQQRVPHHLIDIISPDQHFTVAEFKHRANQAIADIASRGKLPIMVGGTGLYVDSVLYDYQFSQTNAERDQQNPRHLKKTEPDSPLVMRAQTLLLGVQKDRADLMDSIQKRVDSMFRDGLSQEALSLSRRFGWQAPAMQTIGYKEFTTYASGEQNEQEVSQQIVKNTLAYAKRQRTWFKRNKSIQWVENYQQAESLVQNFLSKVSSPA